MSDSARQEHPQCNLSVENKTNVEGIRHEMTQIWECVTALRAEVKEALKEALRRPGWPALVIISSLAALSTGLIVKMLQMGAGH